MDSAVVKQSFWRNTLVRVLFFGVLIIVVRFAYVVTLAGESCNRGDFCFFNLPDNLNFVMPGASSTGPNMAVRTGTTVPNRADLYTSKDWIKAVHFYSSVFQDLIAEGHLSPGSKSLCVVTPRGEDVYALREIGVQDAVGIYKKASKPLVISAETNLVPFYDNAFDFIFSGGDRLDRASRPLNLLASEITRTLKPEGFLVVHVRAKDGYSLNSFLDLFNSCKLIRSRDFDGYDSSLPAIREIILQKESRDSVHNEYDVNLGNGCSAPGHKYELVQHSEPLIMEEPLKPWITLKKNIQNVKYLPSMADISFKNRYVYVDVGARSYGSSIGSWFRKQYPKQNKTFDVYAIEADKTFHKEYREKKKVTLLPYAAWVRNETLSFEINGDPGKEVKAKGRGMGRIQPVKSDKLSLSSSGGYDSAVEKIQGFDFAEWLKSTVTEKDFVVMKMDVEGTEFDLIPRLFQTGAICLVDELFLECHYNRWQRCCPGQRSSKYEKTYGQCLELFTSLRKSGVLVHQWW